MRRKTQTQDECNFGIRLCPLTPLHYRAPAKKGQMKGQRNDTPHSFTLRLISHCGRSPRFQNPLPSPLPPSHLLSVLPAPLPCKLSEPKPSPPPHPNTASLPRPVPCSQPHPPQLPALVLAPPLDFSFQSPSLGLPLGIEPSLTLSTTLTSL